MRELGLNRGKALFQIFRGIQEDALYTGDVLAALFSIKELCMWLKAGWQALRARAHLLPFVLSKVER